ACWSSRASTEASTGTSTRWVTLKPRGVSFASDSHSWATRAPGTFSGWLAARFQSTSACSAEPGHLRERRRAEPASVAAHRLKHRLLPLRDELALRLQGGCSLQPRVPSAQFGFRLARDRWRARAGPPAGRRPGDPAAWTGARRARLPRGPSAVARPHPGG